VRYGVKRGSYFHLTEFFGPVLGVMTADTLEEAIAIQNQIEYGLTAGLHSLNTDELGLWLDTIQAGNLYINRGITGAIVQRQPFGGWKKSAVGAGTKAGGPNYLAGLGGWTSTESTQGAAAGIANRRVQRLVEAVKGELSDLPTWRPCSGRWAPTPSPGRTNSAPPRTSRA
jgi:RHH-type proline utilization regulon transcriptional repressor/proline dehydrogenase/delta 1-pyrroline-5-carboxylate dehydrogenase